MTQQHVHIVAGSHNLQLDRYLIGRLAGIWREQGHRITVGPCATLDAHIGIVHIDQTRIDPRLIPENPGNRPLLNGRALDISKRSVSSNLLSPGTSYRGPVIIKTDANHFGRPERAAGSRSLWNRLRLRVARKIPWRWSRELLSMDYPILDDAADVPRWVWDRPDLVVERFRPEMEGDEFVLRNWLFFGDEEYGARLYSRSPVVKLSNTTHYEYLTSFPESLREARRRLGLDFGKFDYVEVDGEVVLLDANKTPWAGATGNTSPNLLRLAGGLLKYVRQTATR